MNKLLILLTITISFTASALEVVNHKTGKKVQLESFSIKDLQKAIGERKNKCGQDSNCLKPKVRDFKVEKETGGGGLGILDRKTGKVIKLDSYSFKDLEEKLGESEKKCKEGDKCIKKPSLNKKRDDCRIKPGAKSATCKGIVYVAKKKHTTKEAIKAASNFLNRKDTRTYGEQPRDFGAEYIDTRERPYDNGPSPASESDDRTRQK